MGTKRLYLQAIPDGAQLEDQASLRANLSELGFLGGGASVEQLSQQPGDAELRGQYRCRTPAFAEMMVRELRELGNADGFNALPYYRTDTASSDDGYYVVESVLNAGPVRPQEPTIQQFRLRLSEAGTHETHWLGVDTTPVQVDHDFGNDTTPRIAIPATAGKRRWYDPVEGTIADAGTPLATRNAEYGSLDIYDVDAGETAVGTDSAARGPTLLYELSYSDEGVLDPVAWDDNGHASKLDGNSVRQWQHVFASSHEYEGSPILDNGLLRVYVDEAASEVSVERWDDAAGAWEVRSLGPIHNPLDSTTNFVTGSNASVTTVASPSKDGTAVQGTTDATGTQGNRYIGWQPSSAIDLSAAGDIAFWYQVNTVAGSNALWLFDSSGTSESHDFSGQATAGSMVYVTIDSGNFGTVDLTDVTEVRWVYDGDGTGIDKTITIDRFAGPTAWSVFDWDVDALSPTTVRSQVTWTHPSEGHFALDALLDRGALDVRWDIPPDETGPIPTTLDATLDPIASGEAVDPQPVRDLVPRSEVRR